MATEYQRVSETAREMGDGACCQMELIMSLICVCLFVRVSRRRTSDRNTIHSCGWITLIAIQASYCCFLSRARIWTISGYINICILLSACLAVSLILPRLNFMACFKKNEDSHCLVICKWQSCSLAVSIQIQTCTHLSLQCGSYVLWLWDFWGDLLASTGKYLEEYQSAVNGKTICSTNQCVYDYDNTNTRFRQKNGLFLFS